jgi:hypothetical protein
MTSQDTQIPEDIRQEAQAIVDSMPKFTSELTWWMIEESIAKAILAERQRDQWQPIDTAPKDSSILLRLSNGEVFSGWGTEESDGSRTWSRFHATSADVGWLNAKHWMPLPAAPKGGEA